jgi:DNA ligase (NAD+)
MIEQSKKFLKKQIESFTLKDTQKLQDLIQYHSDLYYNKEAPIISDGEYDELFKKLSILESQFGLISKQSEEV